jgi:transmembrane sensor
MFHRVAYLRLEGAIAYTDHLAAVHTFKAGPTTGQTAPGSDGKFHYRRFVIPLLAAASIALMAAIGIPFVNSLMQPPDRINSTNVGGRTLVSFSDHTQIELNTDTVMHYRMTTAERTVWLEKGEAWFHVSHDAAHPFAVVVGKHRVTDLGTEFLVRRNGDDVDVTLLNGRAALSAEGVQTATLNPGDEAIATQVLLSVNHKTPQQLADALAWRRGMLVFRNARLADVVREFNRYNATRLVIADPSIADVKVYAELKTDDFEDLLQLAQTMLKLRVDREGSVILISRRR